MNVRMIPREWLYVIIRILSLVALVFASALAVDYYFSANTFCTQGTSCDVVAKSAFGQKFGIYLPTLGLVSYSFFFISSFFFARTRVRLFGRNLGSFWMPLAILGCAVGALSFVVIQAIEVKAFCWLCMGIDTSALLMVIPAVLLLLGDKSKPAERPAFLHPVLWAGLYVAAVGLPLTWGLYHPAPAAAVGNQAESVAPDYIRASYLPEKVNIVEISSFDCAHCRKLHPDLTKLLEEYGTEINFRRITIPLSKKKEAVIAYYCAEEQNKEDLFAECLFEEPTSETQKLLDYAKQCDIEETAFIACVQSPATIETVEKMIQAVHANNFAGAPTVWIDDQAIIGYNAKLGMTPYRAAIEKSPYAKKSGLALFGFSGYDTCPWQMLICASVAGLLFILGLVLTLRRRKQG